MEAVVFYNLISKVTIHQFCHILFIRSQSVSPVYSQGEGNIQDVNTRRQELSRATLEAAHQSTALDLSELQFPKPVKWV